MPGSERSASETSRELVEGKRLVGVGASKVDDGREGKRDEGGGGEKPMGV